MIYLPELNEVTRRFAALPMSPLTVTARLRGDISPTTGTPIYLDGLLARCVIESHLGCRVLQNTPEAYWLPLPLKMEWQNSGGLPLWSASCFKSNRALADVEYRHKRTPSGRLSDPSRFKSNVGRYMERRTPVTTIAADTLTAHCIGNADEIKKLLANIKFVGKNRTTGHGEVVEWLIADSDINDPLVIDGMSTRAMPHDYASSKYKFNTSPYLVGWTPPQWKPSLFGMGYPTGTQCITPN